VELTDFIQTLITTGKVSIKGQLVSFEEDDIQLTCEFLQQYYDEDVLEMPFMAPSFSAEAALWAAKHFYISVQLTVLRDVEEEKIKELLVGFPGNYTAATIYSADLIFRYLPSLFEIAKGLAPGDVLVKELRHTAALWPFSSVGIDMEGMLLQEDVIFAHPSLRQAYIDRIMEKKDNKRINESVAEHIYETAGDHISILWPEIDSAFKKSKT
jgi:hypothetical protein